jgi:hypothetical protein
MKIERNFITVTLLTFITCGIYGIYFMYKYNEDVNRVCKGIGDDMSYIKAILLGFITCGIYLYIYLWRICDRLCTKAEQDKVEIPVSNSLLMFICVLFIPVFNYYVMCETMNKLDV